jgi:Allophanate hydrolase subunit 1
VQPAAWFGDRAVLVQVDSAAERESIATSLTHQMPEALIRRGMASVLIEMAAPQPRLLEMVEHYLEEVDATATNLIAQEEVHIVVDYNGDDLAGTAAFFDITHSDLIAAHTSQTWRVAMMGFAPGFGYLEPLGDPLLAWESLPRRDNPRAQVPTGSVALAAGMSAVYPSSSPGGWHLLKNYDDEAIRSAQ